MCFRGGAARLGHEVRHANFVRLVCICRYLMVFNLNWHEGTGGGRFIFRQVRLDRCVARGVYVGGLAIRVELELGGL